MLTQSSGGVVVYDSEDEDDGAIARSRATKKGHNKEFAGLAKVDLTTPLREDEVMPKRTHRVVTEHPASKKESKKPRKPKKSKKKAIFMETAGVTTSVGDLLDLGGGFGEIMGPHAPISFASTASASASQTISSAFDDLLSLSRSAPAPQLNPIQLQPASTVNYFELARVGEPPAPKSKAKRPWLKAVLKSSNGSSGAVDWSAVSLLFRVHRFTEGPRVGARLVIRVENHSRALLDALSLDLKNYGCVSFDAIAPQSSSNESEKVGPFFYSAVDAAQEIKASLKTTTSSVSVKIHLPVALLLSPENNISLEQLAEELSTSDWSSTTAKVDLGAINNPEEVKDALGAFLRAELVSGSALSVESGTYAARSAMGAPVRFLVKVMGNKAKIDIKSTSGTLSKALASDLKRIVLTSS